MCQMILSSSLEGNFNPHNSSNSDLKIDSTNQGVLVMAKGSQEEKRS